MKIEIDIPIEEFDYESDYDEYDDYENEKENKKKEVSSESTTI